MINRALCIYSVGSVLVDSERICIGVLQESILEPFFYFYFVDFPTADDRNLMVKDSDISNLDSKVEEAQLHEFHR